MNPIQTSPSFPDWTFEQLKTRGFQAWFDYTVHFLNRDEQLRWKDIEAQWVTIVVNGLKETGKGWGKGSLPTLLQMISEIRRPEDEDAWTAPQIPESLAQQSNENYGDEGNDAVVGSNDLAVFSGSYGQQYAEENRGNGARSGVGTGHPSDFLASTPPNVSGFSTIHQENRGFHAATGEQSPSLPDYTDEEPLAQRSETNQELAAHIPDAQYKKMVGIAKTIALGVESRHGWTKSRFIFKLHQQFPQFCEKQLEMAWKEERNARSRLRELHGMGLNNIENPAIRHHNRGFKSKSLRGVGTQKSGSGRGGFGADVGDNGDFSSNHME